MDDAGDAWQSEGQGFDPPQLHQVFRGVGGIVANPVYFFWSRIEPFRAISEARGPDRAARDQAFRAAWRRPSAANSTRPAASSTRPRVPMVGTWIAVSPSVVCSRWCFAVRLVDG